MITLVRGRRTLDTRSNPKSKPEVSVRRRSLTGMWCDLFAQGVRTSLSHDVFHVVVLAFKATRRLFSDVLLINDRSVSSSSHHLPTENLSGRADRTEQRIDKQLISSPFITENQPEQEATFTTHIMSTCFKSDLLRAKGIARSFVDNRELLPYRYEESFAVPDPFSSFIETFFSSNPSNQLSTPPMRIFTMYYADEIEQRLNREF